MSTREQIKLLIELQKLDSEIYKLKRELEEQPILVENLEGEFKEIEAGLKQNEEELKSLTIKRREKEMELASKEEGIKKLQVQLYQIKTNKEYQAMDKEIANQKADTSIMEEEIINILDQIDACTKEIAKNKKALEKGRQRFTDEKTKIDARVKEIEASLNVLNSKRTELAKKIEKEFLVKYKRILCSKNGLAMVPIQGDACGGCNINLPPQIINEVRLKEELIFCGSCARILYSEEDN